MTNIVQIRNKINNYYKQKKEDYWNNRRKRISKERNDNWNKYYQDSRWKLLRDAYHTAHPCCECCLKQGIVKNGDHVHHVTKFSSGLTEEDKFNLLLDCTNIITLCTYHHSLAHKYMHYNDTNRADVDDIIAYEHQISNPTH